MDTLQHAEPDHLTEVQDDSYSQTGMKLYRIALDLERIARRLHELLPLESVEGMPAIDALENLCDFPRDGSAKLARILMSQPGRMVPDYTLMQKLGCTRKTLVVYASHARKALNGAGYEPGISRIRGRGYYLPRGVVERIETSMRTFT